MKGDGWCVQRYVCPSCNRKGLYYSTSWTNYSTWFCMYTNCKNRFPKDADVVEANPILLTEKPKWKYYKKKC